jgi:hypothetical protein
VDIQRDPSLLRRGLERRCTAGVPDLWPFPRLRITEKELRKGRSTCRGLGYGIDLVAVPTHLQVHGFDPPP